MRQNLACDKNRAGLRTVQLSMNSGMAAPSLERARVASRVAVTGIYGLFAGFRQVFEHCWLITIPVIKPSCLCHPVYTVVRKKHATSIFE